MKAKYILGLSIIVIFVVYAMFSFRQSLTPYVDFETAKRTENTVQIIGDILQPETFYDFDTGTLRFTLEDENDNIMKVEYSGVKPANFDQSTTVVVVGKCRNGLFVADEVLVKCPSKYQGKTR